MSDLAARGLASTTEHAEAEAALDRTIEAVLGHRADAASHLAAALAVDPGLVMGHALAGLMACLQARRSLDQAAARSLGAARTGLRLRGGTPREHAFIASLAAWQEGGDMAQAALHLEQHLLTYPLDAAALKLAHGIRFMLGDSPGLRLPIERALPAWNDEMPHAGYIRGCHAFALEETGDVWRAERVGRHAVALQPADLWGAHAVAHALESSGRAREGIGWLDSVARQMAGLGNFARHIDWHRALFHLHLHEGEAALALYDSRVCDIMSEDYRDLANAASLLWRMAAQGVPVGAARWDALADLAERRIGDHSLVFADLHHVITLAAAGRAASLHAFLGGMRGRALRDTDTQARLHASIGLPLAEGIAAALGGRPAGALHLAPLLRRDLQRVGGSHAQRDVFERLLIEATHAAGQKRAASAMLGERAVRRAPGAWEDGLLGQIAQSEAMRAAASPSSSRICAMPSRSAKIAPSTVVSCTEKLSVASVTSSARSRISTVLRVSPGAKFKVPVAAT